MNEVCKQNNIIFVLAGIHTTTDTYEMLDFCKKNEILNVDISVDTNLKEYNNLPHDAHPSAKANEVYAEKLYSYLVKEILPIIEKK